MLKNAELAYKDKIISLTFKNGVIEDLVIFQDNEIILSVSRDEAISIRNAIDFALAWNFDLNESGLRDGAEDDDQEEN